MRAGMPVLLLAAGQAGATSPAALAGAVVQEVAEVLAGLVYVNLISPGHPAIFGPWPFVSDLRTGAMSGGSGEQALLTAACAQMGQFYDLPTGVPAGMSDAKLPDAQAGYEKGMTNLLAAQAGGNLIYESAGMHASLLGCCLESFVVDNDMLGAILRTVRGIEVSDDSLSLEAMREVCLGGPSHFLGHDQTLQLMQAEYLYPEVACRRSPKEWVEHGSADILDHARARLHTLLSSHYPRHIPPSPRAARDPLDPLPAPHRPGARPPDQGALPGAPAGSANAPRPRALVKVRCRRETHARSGYGARIVDKDLREIEREQTDSCKAQLDLVDFFKRRKWQQVQP